MKPSIKILLAKKRPKHTGKYPVKLQVIFQRKMKQYPFGIDLTNEEFDYVLNPAKYKGRFDAKTKRDLVDVQVAIHAKFAKANEIITKMIDFSFSIFERKLNQKKLANTDVYQYYENIIQRFRDKDRLGTADTYQCSLSSLKLFRPELSFREITVDFLEAYEAWFLGRGRSISTVGIYLRPLRAVMNEAISDGIISRESHYPFGKRLYQIPASKNIKKALTMEEIGKFFQFEALPGTWQEKSRDFFIFSYLCNGINMKDICLLKNIDIQGEYIRYTRAKTQHTHRSSNTKISIYVSPESQAIINRWRNADRRPEAYLFPILTQGMNAAEQMLRFKQFTQNVNKNIKKIATTLGIDKHVTTYFARHSFATVLRRSGASTEMISESLGHTSTKTTASYLDSFEDDKRKEIMAALTNFDTK
ncbi:MAG: site-specific integrase [Bacteroidetes bacterium]|nr:site-specific integrase [Bacteroidota bacterium]